MRTGLLMLGLLTGLAGADRMVLVPAGKTVTEPGQKAVVAFNGEEEILLLATDLVAREPTRVLQALPLPGKPLVTLANPDLLKNMAALFEARRAVLLGHGLRSGSEAGSIKLISHQKLGPHELVVLELDGTEGLNSLLQQHLQQTLSPAAVDLVEGYRKRGCRYLAVDLVDVGTRPGSVPPVSYRFKSPSLFYPLMTSNLVGGTGAVDLFVMAPPEAEESFARGTQLPFPNDALDPVTDDIPDSPVEEDLPGNSRHGSTWPVKLSPAEVTGLDAGLGVLFPRGAQLIVHHYEGPLKFARDLSLSASWLGLGPVQGAAARGDLELLRSQLSQHPGAVDETDFLGRTPLFLAAASGALPVVRALLAGGARLDARGPYGNTPLHEAAASRQAPVVAVLLEAGAKLSDRNRYGSTPLHRAIWDLATADLLLKAGADVNAVDDQGQTALMEAARWGPASVLELLASRGGGLHTTDRAGNTVLHAAAQGGRADNVRLLLKLGLFPTVRNLAGKTPPEVATGAAAEAFGK